MSRRSGVMQVLVTGANGFVGKNLISRLKDSPRFTIASFTRSNTPDELDGLVSQSDAIVHLAGENRPASPDDFVKGNTELTQAICNSIRKSGTKIPILFASTTQAHLDNPYGLSKRLAEDAVKLLCDQTGNPGVIFQLPGVFGKWCKPNYNSVVATFCYNIARDIPIQVHNPVAEVRLVHIDDVVGAIIASLESNSEGLSYGHANPEYRVTIGGLADQIRHFKLSRIPSPVDGISPEFAHALYSTFLSYLPPSLAAYEPRKADESQNLFDDWQGSDDAVRASSIHSKVGESRNEQSLPLGTSKLMVSKGLARFSFENVLSGERFDFETSSQCPKIVEVLPGWKLTMTNTGPEDLVTIAWASNPKGNNQPAMNPTEAKS